MASAATDSRTRSRRRNARGRGEALREQLLEAAVDVLDAEGDASRVSVRAIARTAGVSPTALYLHFPERDALVSAAVDRGFGAFNAALMAAAAAPAEPRERARAMGLAYLEFARRQPALYTVLFSTRRPMGRPPSVPADASDRVDHEAALDELVEAVSAAVPDACGSEARDLALVLWAGLHGYAALVARGERRGWPDAERYVDRLLVAHLGD